MGFRFRKSIKIAPGVRMNIGKRGVSSISAGSFNFGKRGAYQNINIPGTGISYRARVAGRSQAKSTPARPSQRKTTKRMPVTIELLDDGSVVFTDKKGKPLPDSLIREAKRQNRATIEQWLSEQSDKYNAEILALLNIHLTTPAPQGEITVNPRPEPPQIKKHGLRSKILDGHRQKVDERNKLARQEYDRALRNWEEAENALRTDTEVMSNVLSSAISSLIWPRETLVSFDVVDGGDKVLLDVDLPEIEDMPSKESRVNKRQLSLTIKDRSQKQIRLDYLNHIHSIGFRFIGDVFAHLPSVSQVVFSGYSQRVSKRTGHVEDEYLYSVRVKRDVWERINFNNLDTLDIVECFEQFELQRKVTKTGVISPIEPFEQ
jgi:hypothetical protein